MRIREQIPVSRDARFKVVLLEPKALAQANGGTMSASASMLGLSNGPAGYLVSAGVRVRWVPLKELTADEIMGEGTNGSEVANAESAQGLLEWVCEVDAGASVDVALVYEVSAPAGVNWSQNN